MAFRKDFIWGAATASYQVEGGHDADGKGLSIWDVFTERGNTIKDNSTGKVASDHYHKWQEDVNLMAQLGLNAYRFSLSWARILPDGTGKINQKGLDFYDRLVDALLEKGISPFVTMYHWDLPQALAYKGGWFNRDIANWFGEYTNVVTRCFGDRVKNYFTVNEPQVFVNAGYINGEHAPGYIVGIRDELAVTHNILRSHGAAVSAIRANTKAQVGFASAGYPATPLTPQDYKTAYEYNFACDKYHPGATTALYGDTIIFGDYPKDYYKWFEPYLPLITKEDLKSISQPIDFYGQNCYAGNFVTTGKNGEPIILPEKVGEPHTTMGWNIQPECLYTFTKILYERYKLPIYITENGAAYTDIISADGKIHDTNRVDYIKNYIAQLEKSANEGNDIRGYFYWSFLDNFEWREGYTQRFGIVHVDYDTLVRTKKDSFDYYANIIKNNGSFEK